MRRRDAWTLAAIVLLAAALRVREALRAPLWFDELFTLAVARLPLGAAVDLMRHDMHPPLFFVATSAWRALGGESELWLRLLPMVAGIALVGVVFGWAREAFGTGAGLLAALLLALHRTHVFYSQELRGYAWLWLLLAAAAWAALRWARGGRLADAAFYTVAAALAMWTHYLALPVLGVIGAWGLAAAFASPRGPEERRSRRVLAWCGINLAVLALFALQVPTFVAQMAVNRADHWVPAPSLADLFEWARQLAFGANYLVVAGAMLVVAAFRRPRARDAAGLAVLAIAVPVAVAWVLTRGGARLFTVHYMLYAIPFACVLVAGGIASLTPRLLRWGVAGAIVLLAARSMALRGPLAEPAELARAAEWMAPRLRPGDVVYHAESHSYLFFRHYHAAAARHVLLIADTLPYYEGARVIPDRERVGLAEFETARARGEHWFGVRARHVGMDGDTVVARFEKAAGPPALRASVVSAWESTGR